MFENQFCLLPHMCEGKPFFMVVIILVVYIPHTLFFVTSFSAINRDKLLYSILCVCLSYSV